VGQFLPVPNRDERQLELDFWGKFRRAIESDSAAWLATIADYDNALVSLTADVANSYIRIRTLEKRLVIAAKRSNSAGEPRNRRGQAPVRRHIAVWT